MSHAGPEPERPSTRDAHVPSPRGSGQGHEGTERLPAPQTGRWGSQNLPRLASAILFGLLCVVGFGLMVNGLLGAVLVFPGQSVLSALMIAVVGALAFWLLRRVRPVTPPSKVFSLLALIWGMTAAVGLALVANGNLSAVWNTVGGLPFGSAWGAALTAPINEELLKVAGIVLIAVMAPRVVRGPMDGFVIGALVGLGFQVVEDFTYSLNVIAMQGGVDGIVAVVQTFILRVVLTGLGSHWAMTAVAGTAVGLVAAASWRPDQRRALWAALLLLIAVGVHWFFDTPLLGDLFGAIAKTLVVFVTAMVVYFVVRHAYRARVRRALAEEGDELGLRRSSAVALASRHGRRRELRKVPQPERPAAAERQDRMVAMAEDRASEYRVPIAPGRPE
ncbi:PrsW family intramembrane metalloprotease [Nocardiopsis sp. MG754419]|uniref:PrsW family intramembrane metalloprotease n=1 Tax=Nocardiopsis sp. MG754419 TaxID=2259865 RepID=UPI001BAD906E|nr:PrsW family intramembrane metalloprotease [Nocardiopsis sp. MG754419]MBR8740147.1 PrsW family intramembrane metalloprotease [Nocardiopsis sp. MG754419]